MRRQKFFLLWFLFHVCIIKRCARHKLNLKVIVPSVGNGFHQIKPTKPNQRSIYQSAIIINKMVWYSTGKRGQPRSRVGRILPQDIVLKTIQTLHLHKEVPVQLFPTLYKSAHDQIFDAVTMGYSDGIIEFFLDLSNMVNVRCDKSGLSYISLRQNEEQSEKKHSSEKDEHLNPLFRKSNTVLWHNKLSLLAMPYLIIAQSPLEIAVKRHPQYVKEEINRIKMMLSNHPNGIRLNEISRKVTINKKLFSATCINSLTQQLPEIFYRVDRSGEEPLVFDGSIKTHPDLLGQDVRSFGGYNPMRIAADAHMSGLYQKTLLLMRECGSHGLKIVVWLQSIQCNFRGVCDEMHVLESHLLNKIGALRFFLALARFGLVELKSAEGCKNDLRAFCPPSNTNFVEILPEILEGCSRKVAK